MKLHFLLASAGLMTASVVFAQGSADEAGDSRLHLWQGMREGMTAEEAAVRLRAIDGIESVKVRQGRKDPLSIRYTTGGVQLAGLSQKIVPIFGGNQLQSLSLQSSACLDRATVKFNELRALLGEKYGDVHDQREVTESGQEHAARASFSAEGVRIVLRLEPGEVPTYTYMSGKIGRAISKTLNDSVDAERAECPADRGQKALVEIAYSNEAAAAASDAMRKSEAEEKRAEDKGKL